MNVWTFTGNLGRDADARYLPDGTSVVSFSAAVKSGYGDKAATTWPKCTIFGKRGESLQQYLIKGVQVAVAGEVSLREWQDKDGSKRQSLDVRVSEITLLGGGKREDVATPAPQRARPVARPATTDFDDDIPF
jgi:single-strand DNA-binding protein